jgi:hypothetical protein
MEWAIIWGLLGKAVTVITSPINRSVALTLIFSPDLWYYLKKTMATGKKPELCKQITLSIAYLRKMYTKYVMNRNKSGTKSDRHEILSYLGACVND